MRVLVTGGRDYANDFFVSMTLASIGKLFNDDVTLIVGDATGVDAMARKSGEALGWNVQVFEADWDEHGRAAGPIRNKRMIEEGKPDVVVAYPGGRGTADCVSQAGEAGVLVQCVRDYESFRGVMEELRKHFKGQVSA